MIRPSDSLLKTLLTGKKVNNRPDPLFPEASFYPTLGILSGALRMRWQVISAVFPNPPDVKLTKGVYLTSLFDTNFFIQTKKLSLMASTLLELHLLSG